MKLTAKSDLPPVVTLATRDRLIAAMMQALSTRGFHGVGLNEILAVAAAPKGVLYHHFPGGKSELAQVAISASTEQMVARVTKSFGKKGDLASLLAKWFEASALLLSEDQFERGCPLATVALETTAADVALRRALANSFAQVTGAIALALESHGHPPQGAKALASLIVSAYEGALIQARVAHDPAPIRQAALALAPLLTTR